jgi:hypothetical protein
LPLVILLLEILILKFHSSLMSCLQTTAMQCSLFQFPFSWAVHSNPFVLFPLSCATFGTLKTLDTDLDLDPYRFDIQVVDVTLFDRLHIQVQHRMIITIILQTSDLTFCISKFHFNVVLPYALRSKWFFISGFRQKFCLHFSPHFNRLVRRLGGPCSRPGRSGEQKKS